MGEPYQVRHDTVRYGAVQQRIRCRCERTTKHSQTDAATSTGARQQPASSSLFAMQAVRPEIVLISRNVVDGFAETSAGDVTA